MSNIEKILKHSEKILKYNLSKRSIKQLCNFIYPFDKNENKIKIAHLLYPLLENINGKDYIDLWCQSNKKALKKISELLIKIASEEKEPNNIDIDDYELFIFDADKTIWEGEQGAYAFKEPFELINKNELIDSEGKKIKLKDGFREALIYLRSKNKDVGIISKSEARGVDYQHQPVILLLKAFGLFDHINDMIVCSWDIPKSSFIPTDKRVLFVDDDDKNIKDVLQKTEADVIDAKDIEYKHSSVTLGVDFLPKYVINKTSSFDIKNNGKEKYFIITNKDPFYFNDYSINELHCVEENFDFKNQNLIIADLTFSGLKKFAKKKNDYVPVKDRPPKPKGNGKYELDHKNPKHRGGTNKKNNLQWLSKEDHKKKSQEEGSFKDGGEKKQQQEKSKGKEHYKKYQSDAGKAKIDKERKEMGEKAFSELQRKRVQKRWRGKKKSSSWYSFFKEN